MKQVTNAVASMEIDDEEMMFVKKKQGTVKTEEEKQKELAQKDLGGR